MLSGAIGATSGSLSKTGSGSLELTNTNLYSGTTTISGGFLRVGSSGSLGTSTSNTAVDLSRGTLEIRSDVPNFSTKGLSVASSTLFLDHAVSSPVLNQTAVFKNLAQGALTVNGRNGYGVTFVASSGTTTTGLTYLNDANGLVTYNGNVWNLNNTLTLADTLAFSGNGNSQINGNVIATAAGAHSVSKFGTGTLTILATGTGSSYTGRTNIRAGTVAINSIKALNNDATGAAAQINLGDTFTTGALTFTGSGPAADYSVAKTVNLVGVTGGATINANQTGTNPVLLSANFVATGGLITDAKTLTLGGTNAADNTVNGIIPNNAAGGTVNLAKTGSGTWVLAGANTYTGNTTISDGTLKLRANGATSTIVANGANLIFDINGGTLDLVGQATTSHVETLGELTPTAGASVVKLSPGASGTMSLVFVDTVSGSSTAGLGAVNNSAGVNFIASGAGNSIRLNGVGDGFLDAHLYYNGSDFAVASGGGTGVLAAASYPASGFATSATILTNAAHNQISGSFSQAAETIRSLKINGSQTLTLTGLLTVNAQGLTTGATSDGGILQTGGTGVITGTGISTVGIGNLAVRVDGAADKLTLSAPISSTTTGGLTKNGAGTLVLNASNAQTGQTTINEGTLQLSGTATLSGSNQNLVVRKPGTFDLNGVSTGTRIASFSGEGTVTNSNTAPATLTVGINTVSSIFAGIIGETAGQITVIKQATGSQTLSGVNTYSGSTTINSTGLIVAATLANGGVPSSIGQSSNAASNLAFGGASATQVFGGLSYTGAASVSIDRLFTFAGTAANSGARILANGANNATLIWSNPGPLAFGTANVAQGLLLGGASTGDNTFNPHIADNGTGAVSVFKSDAGLWIMGNSGNTYTGATTIVNGTLQSDGMTLPAASGLVVGTGVGTGPAPSFAIFQSSGNFTRSLGTGAGQVAFLATGTNTNAGFAGSTAKFNVNIGSGSTLTWGAANTFGQSTQALALNSTTALSEVDIQNPIDLNGPATRQIQVLDNTSAGTDFATISGVISGT